MLQTIYYEISKNFNKWQKESFIPDDKAIPWTAVLKTAVKK